MSESMSRCLPAALATLLLAVAPAGWAADLTVDVKNVKRSSGRVLVALFNQADGFPRKGYWRGEDVAAVPGTVRVVFHDVPAGTYAVTAFHDLDGNKKLNTNGLGIPTEPLAFSNDAVGVNGPPSYADASFKTGADGKALMLTLK